ncbi:MAG: hypothetical protein ACR2HF_02560 [Methylococcaceae bacterium]
MFKEMFHFRKEDLIMWGGIGAFGMVILAALSLIGSNGFMIFKDLIGLVVVILLPGYVIVKLFLDNFQVSENMTKDPDINKAIDKVIMSMGCGVCSIIPLNFVWNYMLTMGGGEGPKGNIWGNVDEELIYTGSASYRALLTVVVVLAVTIGIKIFLLKKKPSSSE